VGDLVNMLTTVTPRIAYVADALSPDFPLGDSVAYERCSRLAHRGDRVGAR
jgi:hypothetical protein